MMLSLAKLAPERINKAAMLVPSGIAHGELIPIITKMSIPFMKYYHKPSKQTLNGIMEVMSDRDDELCAEFFDIMMSTYKMEMRSPKEYRKSELKDFRSPVMLFASNEDIFFPADKVFKKAAKIFPSTPKLCLIRGKHMPHDKTMEKVCHKITAFFGT